MARESSLWKRLKLGIVELKALGYPLHMTRIENAAGVGHSDVEGCLDGGQVWIELKSCERPARPTTVIRPKCRPSQSIWHRERSEAGGRVHWILIQVGENKRASLYLIPGCFYDQITATEAELKKLSVILPNLSPANVLLRARTGW